MDKLTTIKIKYEDETYSDEIPVSVLAENVEWDATHTLVDILGSIDVDAAGTIQDQISRLFNEKVSATQLQDYVASQLNDIGANPVVVDSSLTISGAAADAKSVGDALAASSKSLDDLKSTFENTSIKPPYFTEIVNVQYSGLPTYAYRPGFIGNFRAGVTYRFAFTVNKFTFVQHGIYIRTTNSTNPQQASSYIDSVFLDGLNPVLGTTYYADITMSADAKYINLYFNGRAGTELDYTIQIYEKNNVDFIYSTNALFTDICTQSVALNSGEASRLFYPVHITAGKTYVCNILASNFNQASTDVFALRSNASEDSASIIETLVEIENKDFHQSGKYSVLFEATKDADYIYIYCHPGTGSDPTLSFSLYELTSEQYAYNLQNPSITIYGIGDSIMYAGTFMETLKLRHNINYIAYAEGSTGYSTNNNDSKKTTFYDRVTAMSNETPDLVIIEGGTNDFGKNKTIAETEAGVTMTLDNLSEKYPGVPILVLLPTQRNYTGTAASPRYMTNDIGIDLIDYVEAIKAIVNRYGYKAIDLYHESGLNAASSANDTGSYNSALLTIDGLHWTEAFHKRIAEIIYPWIKRYALTD